MNMAIIVQTETALLQIIRVKNGKKATTYITNNAFFRFKESVYISKNELSCVNLSLALSKEGFLF